MKILDFDNLPSSEEVERIISEMNAVTVLAHLEEVRNRLIAAHKAGREQPPEEAWAGILLARRFRMIREQSPKDARAGVLLARRSRGFKEIENKSSSLEKSNSEYRGTTNAGFQVPHDKGKKMRELQESSFQDIPAAPGIYRIASGYGSYVGQSRNLRSRIKQHATLLYERKHSNSKLSLVYEEVGEDLLIEVIERCPNGLNRSDMKKWLDAREAYWMERYGRALNIAAANAPSFDAEKNALMILENKKELSTLKAELGEKEELLRQSMQEWNAGISRLEREKQALRLKLKGTSIFNASRSRGAGSAA